jgi:hypothetical protein
MPSFPSSLDLEAQAAENWANAGITANDCLTAQNLTGEFLGSAFDARDWMSVVDALGEDGLLRYYGKSYIISSMQLQSHHNEKGSPRARPLATTLSPCSQIALTK